MENIKRRRSAQTGCITKVCSKLQYLQLGNKEDPIVPQLKKHLASLNTAFTSWKAVHQEIADTFADSLNWDEEDEALEQ